MIWRIFRILFGSINHPILHRTYAFPSHAKINVRSNARMTNRIQSTIQMIFSAFSFFIY